MGNNEDAWGKDPWIWFVPGNDSLLGTAYVGHKDMFPQGAMNEAGLAYDAFTVYKRSVADNDKPRVNSTRGFLEYIMRHFSTVDEIHSYALQFDRRMLNGGMFLFVDASGKYLIMEVDTMMLGNEAEYPLVNFCPSQISDPAEVKMERYHRGLNYMETVDVDSSLAYISGMMETMHECRSRLGDGTLYTSIYDLQDGLIHLYFYHDFTNPITFNLKDELTRGSHLLYMTDLFPRNEEYLAFASFLTPFTSKGMMVLVLSLILLLLLSIPVYIRLLRKESQHRAGLLFLIIMNLVQGTFLVLLLLNEPAFYFDFPYSYGSFGLIYGTAYIPFLLVLGLPVAVALSIRAQGRLCRLSVLNSLLYLTLLVLFVYWFV